MHARVIALTVSIAVFLIGCGHRDPTAAPPAPSTSVPAAGPTLVAAKPANVSSLHMTTATTGWAVAGGRILRTSDGGSTWVDVTPPHLGALPAEGSATLFLETAHAWAVVGGASGFAVYRTTDAGTTWSAVAVPAPDHWAFSLSFVDPMHGELLAQQPEGAGKTAVAIYRTTDGGASWSKVSETRAVRSTAGALPYGAWSPGDIAFASATVGWAQDAFALPQGAGGPFVGGYQLFGTTDGGTTWSKASLPVPSVPGSLVSVSAPTFFSPQVGVAPVMVMMTSEPARQGHFFTFDHTVDGGQTWSTEPQILCQGVFDWLDARHGWVVSTASLRVTADGGKTWTEVHSNISVGGVRQLDFTDGQIGWAVEAGGGRTLLKTTDGGQTWTAQGDDTRREAHRNEGVPAHREAAAA